MPTSRLEVTPAALHLVWQVRPQDRPLELLDVGPGLGKYGLLVREYVDRDAQVHAVEAEKRYITPRLEAIYDDVVYSDVTALPSGYLESFDVVLMIDVLEHLDAGDAATLLARIPGWVVICTPRDWFQNPEADEYPTERHRSHWTEATIQVASAGRVEYADRRALRDHGAVLVRLRPQR